MEEFIPFFNQYLPQLAQAYNWPVRPKTKEGLPDFSWHQTSGTMAECVDMKRHLTDAWGSADETKRHQLARWVVSDWGGVRANSPATLATYVDTISQGAIPLSLRGVASYSKILSVANCTQYAIYDARVAASLNAVQLLYTASEKSLFFHYIPGRNKIIQGNKQQKGFVQVFTKNELVRKRGWQEVSKDASYATYLALLQDLKQNFPTYEIYHFEMALFSMAPVLCRKAVEAQEGIMTKLSQ